MMTENNLVVTEQKKFESRNDFNAIYPRKSGVKKSITSFQFQNTAIKPFHLLWTGKFQNCIREKQTSPTLQ